MDNTTQDQRVPTTQENFVQDQCVPGDGNPVRTPAGVLEGTVEAESTEKTSSHERKIKQEREEKNSSNEDSQCTVTENSPKRRKIEDKTVTLPAEEDASVDKERKDSVIEEEFHDVAAALPVPRSCDEAVVPSFHGHEE